MFISLNRFQKIGFFFVVFLIAIILIQTFIFKTATVIGNSMAPTISENQVVLYNRLSYYFSDVSRGDVIIIERDDGVYIKRVVGLPNETLSFFEQQLIVDGFSYQQNFITDSPSFWTHDVDETVIPEDHYYVVGDNRRQSRDSRNSFGYVHSNNIIGRVELVIFPFNELKTIY